MTGIESMPVATLIVIGTLLATVVALWLPPWWSWIAGVSATILAGYVAGLLDGPAGLAFVLLAFALWRCRAHTGWARAGYGAVVAAVSMLLALHLAPGFRNPVVIRDVVLSPGAVGYTQYANVDKGLAGVLIVGTLGFARLRSAPAWDTALRQA